MLAALQYTPLEIPVPLRRETATPRPVSIVAPGWWDYTTLDRKILDDAARLTPKDLEQLSRPGFKVVMYDTLEDFYLAEALEYITAWKQATPSKPAGIGSHIPEVIEYAEEKGWETDSYMTCFYNLARQYKSAPAKDQNAYAKDKFPAEDPPRMTALMRKLKKPCIAFKIMAASRNCTTPKATRAAFEYAFANIKPTDAVDVGMFQKYRNQVAENAGFVREILREREHA